MNHLHLPSIWMVLFACILLIASISIQQAQAEAFYHNHENYWNDPKERVAPLLSSEGAKTIPGRYIVHLKDVAADGSLYDPLSRYSIHGGLDILHTHTKWLIQELSLPDSKSRLLHTYDMDGFLGYSGEFAPPLLEKIRHHPAVDFIEADQPVWALDSEITLEGELDSFMREKILQQSNPMMSTLESTIDSLHKFFENVKENIMRRKRALFPSKSPTVIANCSRQEDAPWGLTRVCTGKKTDGKKNRHYTYPKSAGSGIDVYVIDTGININHVDFEGRAKWGSTIPEFDLDVDGNGHGTHCAGIVGGKTYGIAKNATLIAVKVLRTNGFGTNADVIKGVEWVLNQHRISARRGRRSVVNMSLGGGKSIALERAVDATVSMGVHFAVAAGNDNVDACNYSPAGSKKAVTVGASTITDGMAYFSNVGPCVDIFAPGLDITSTWIGSDVAVNTISGTSMAAPHVAGVMALYLALQEYTPEELKTLILESAAQDLLSELPNDTVNRLLSSHALLESLSKRMI